MLGILSLLWVFKGFFKNFGGKIMDTKKIRTRNYNGEIREIEVSLKVWKFDKDDFCKQDWQKEKDAGRVYSYDEICCQKESGHISKLPKNFGDISAENEYIQAFNHNEHKNLIQKLHKALNQLSDKQRKRIILRFFRDVTISRIAKTEKSTERTIYLTISSAINRLDEILSKKKIKNLQGLPPSI